MVVYGLQNNLAEMEAWLKKFLNKIPKEQELNVSAGYAQYAAYCFAKMGIKKKVLEISKHWRVYLALGMKKKHCEVFLKMMLRKRFLSEMITRFSKHICHITILISSGRIPVFWN